MTTQTTITAVSVDHATIGGQQHKWHTLIHAAVQDTVGASVLASGVLAWPNEEHAIAEAYRVMLRGALPLIEVKEQTAYATYCGSSSTTRGSDAAHRIGHGSWVSGPDGQAQASWYAWKNLKGRIAAAADGRLVN